MYGLNPRRIDPDPRTFLLMISIGKLGSGQERYYTEKIAEGAEDYYSGDGEAEGQWIGQGATQFDLEGKVEPEQLTAMLTGRNPATGEPLGLKSARGREPVPGNTCASMLFEEGRDMKQVAEWLGHADPAFTLLTMCPCSTTASGTRHSSTPFWTAPRPILPSS
jgi:hypothetical protein